MTPGSAALPLSSTPMILRSRHWVLLRFDANRGPFFR